MVQRVFDEAESIGRFGEYATAYYLRSGGRMVCHHGGEGEQEFEGRTLLTDKGNIILPDLSWWKREGSKQRFYWGDVKTKTHCVFYHNAGEWRTGCELYSLDRYRLVSAQTQKHCFLFFLQLRGDSTDGPCPTGLFWASTAQLFASKRAQVWRENGMIYWDVAVLQLATDLQTLWQIPKCRHYLQLIYNIVGSDPRQSFA